MRTVQLRRYSIIPGELNAFTEWWAATMPALREQAGFNVEFAFAVAERSEFVWAVSVDGPRDRFEQAERDWIASPQRAAAFVGLVERVERQIIAFAEDVTGGAGNTSTTTSTTQKG